LETTYSLTADVNAAFAYDAVEIIAAAITKAGSTSHSAVRNAVLALKNFSDAQGPVNFNQYGDGDSTVYIVEIENGAPVYQTTVALPVIPYIAVG
jgi:branched-chain amino acid transport system substrate-binding protein